MSSRGSASAETRQINGRKQLILCPPPAHEYAATPANEYDEQYSRTTPSNTHPAKHCPCTTSIPLTASGFLLAAPAQTALFLKRSSPSNVVNVARSGYAIPV